MKVIVKNTHHVIFKACHIVDFNGELQSTLFPRLGGSTLNELYELAKEVQLVQWEKYKGGFSVFYYKDHLFDVEPLAVHRKYICGK